jgi:hypothetical protein
LDTDRSHVDMEYTGYATLGEYDAAVIRGDLARRELIAFWPPAGGFWPA